MSRNVVLKSDWHNWKQDPVTRALLHDLNALREQYKEDMAEGHHDDVFLRTSGICQGLKDAIEYIAHAFDVVSTEDEDKNGD